MNQKCVLCGKPLGNEPQNSEHYVYNSTIRRFSKLGIPGDFNYALRVDTCATGEEATLAPRAAHKEWATVRVHVKCNQAASYVPKNLADIIDALDRPGYKPPPDKVDSVLEYYAHLWRLQPEQLRFEVVDPKFSAKDSAVQIYEPGYLWLGKIRIVVKDSSKVLCPGKEWYSIYIGTKPALEELLRSFA